MTTPAISPASTNQATSVGIVCDALVRVEPLSIYGTPVKSAVTTGATRDAALLSGPRKEEAKVSAVPPLLCPNTADLPTLAERTANPSPNPKS